MSLKFEFKMSLKKSSKKIEKQPTYLFTLVISRAVRNELEKELEKIEKRQLIFFEIGRERLEKTMTGPDSRWAIAVASNNFTNASECSSKDDDPWPTSCRVHFLPIGCNFAFTDDCFCPKEK